MAWCEANRRRLRLRPRPQRRAWSARIADELAEAEADEPGAGRTGAPLRRLRLAHAGQLEPRRGAWSPRPSTCPRGQPALRRHLAAGQRDRRPRTLYEEVYCARGEVENRIKEQQLDLFADRTSAATMRANQLRLWFASFAYVLLDALRRIGLRHTQFAAATCGTIRLKLLEDRRPGAHAACAASRSPWPPPAPIRPSTTSPIST